MPAQKMAQVPREEQIHENDGQRNDSTDQALGQYAQRAADVESQSSCQRWSDLAQRLPEEVHRKRNPEAEDHIGQKNARESEDAARRQQAKCCIEASLLRSKQPSPQHEYNDEQRQRIKSQRQTRSP